MTRKDPQQQAVYRWESEWKNWNRDLASLKELRDVIRWACLRYGVKRIPAVKQHNSRELAYSIRTDELCVISFGKTSKNAETAIHEAAHQICDTVFPTSTTPHHGVEWLGIHMALMQDAKVIPTVALHATARAHGLKWLSYGEIGPKAFKNRLKGT